MYTEIQFTHIRYLLVLQGMTRYPLSDKSGVFFSFLLDLLRSQANPSLETRARLARALDVAVPELRDAGDAAMFFAPLPTGFARGAHSSGNDGIYYPHMGYRNPGAHQVAACKRRGCHRRHVTQASPKHHTVL